MHVNHYVYKRVHPLTHRLNTDRAIQWKIGPQISVHNIGFEVLTPNKTGFCEIMSTPPPGGQTSETRFRAIIGFKLSHDGEITHGTSKHEC